MVRNSKISNFSFVNWSVDAVVSSSTILLNTRLFEGNKGLAMTGKRFVDHYGRVVVERNYRLVQVGRFG